MAERKTKEKRQEELSKKLGDLMIAANHAQVEDLVHVMKRTDDYIITLAIENAEGRYVSEKDGDLDWDKPEGYGYQHVEIMVQDRDYKTFVPYLNVLVRIYDKENNLVTENVAPFMWHPFTSHYGFDIVLPKDGEYSFEVNIDAPKFDRHHKSHGKRYSDKISTKLGPVEIMVPGSEEDDILNQ